MVDLPVSEARLYVSVPQSPKAPKSLDADEALRSRFDLPPAARAKPLSVQKPQTRTEVLDNDVDRERKSNKRRKPNFESEDTRKKAADDTPKQFARLMAWSQEGRALRKGLDDGEMGKKERSKKNKTKVARKTNENVGDGSVPVHDGVRFNKDVSERAHKARTKSTKPPIPAKHIMSQSLLRDQEHDDSAPVVVEEKTKLRIKPGERLQDFALRVDQTLPLSSVPKHSTRETVNIPQLKSQQNLTKHNKKLLRLQSQWREEEKRRKDKGEEREDELQDQKEEDSLLWSSVHGQQSSKKGKKMKAGGVDERDIWKVLEKKDEGPGKMNVLTASQMVQEPPKLGRLKNIFKEPGGRPVAKMK